MDFSQGYCALKFGAQWCQPCKVLEPNIKKMAEEFTAVQIHSVDVDDEPALCKQFQIKSVPTVILLLDGKEINRITGAVLMEPLRKAFRDFVNTQRAA